MTSIKMLLLTVMITFSTVLSASTTPKKTIESDIAKRLEHPTFILEQDVVTNVTFVINKKNEIVILSVDSDNVTIVDYIKTRLNYTKVSDATYNRNLKYILPVKLAIER